MSRFGLRAAALLAALWTVSAPAADLMFLKTYDWAGPYLGANLGYAWGSVNNNPANPSGFAAGALAGYNWYNGPWVFGVEGDLEATGAGDTFAPWKFSNPWFGTVRGRAGYALGNILFYGTAGLAFGELRGETFGLSDSHTTAGWTAGVGAEYGFAANWGVKIEYLYVDLSESHFMTTNVSNSYRFGTLRAGLNYRFNAR